MYIHTYIYSHPQIDLFRSIRTHHIYIYIYIVSKLTDLFDSY